MKKRTCSGCKAFKPNQTCWLGYAIEFDTDPKSVLITKNHRPKDDCPKPKTNSEFVYLSMKK